MARKEFLDYVWKYCIEPQLGYSFSLNHTLPYSVIAVQEANLATRWNPLYWQCACLCVNAGNYSDGMSDEEECDEPSEIVDPEESEGTKKKRVAPNYGKIAKAISDSQLSGVKIELPNINTAEADFVPDIINNSILFSLKGVTTISDELFEQIKSLRPFVSIEDFVDKVKPTPVQMIGIIKAGCFDGLYSCNRVVIMEKYLQLLADERFPLKDKLTATHLKTAIKLGFSSTTLNENIRVFKYKNYLDKFKLDSLNKQYVLDEDVCIVFFNNYIKSKLNLSKMEYYISGETIRVKQSAMKRVCDSYIAPIIEFLNTDEGLKLFQKLQQEEFIDSMKEKYCNGSLSKWEFDTMCFYYSGHELSGVNFAKYDIYNFYDLEEEPTKEKKYCAIAGTITNTNNTKHVVSILTTHGVVDVKLFSGEYNKFNQVLSVIDDSTKKKTIIDDSWFRRGNKVIFYGYRKGDLFQCRRTTMPSGFSATVGLITSIHADGTIELRYSRHKK